MPLWLDNLLIKIDISTVELNFERTAYQLIIDPFSSYSNKSTNQPLSRDFKIATMFWAIVIIIYGSFAKTKPLGATIRIFFLIVVLILVLVHSALNIFGFTLVIDII